MPTLYFGQSGGSPFNSIQQYQRPILAGVVAFISTESMHTDERFHFNLNPAPKNDSSLHTRKLLQLLCRRVTIDTNYQTNREGRRDRFLGME